MAHTLYDTGGVFVTRYYGGKSRGPCYQIGTDRDRKYIELTEREFIHLVTVMHMHMMDVVQERENPDDELAGLNEHM